MRRAALPRLVTALACVVACAACPSEEDVDARAFINALFDASVVCFPSFLAEAEPVFLEAQALAQIDAAVATFERQRADPAVTFSRAAYDACLRVAAERDCGSLSGDDSPCASVFVGTRSSDDVCAENVQCATGLSCVQDRDACGVCRPVAVIGESCAAANCQDGAFCDENEFCRTQPDSVVFEEGQPCNALQGCGGLLHGLSCSVAPNQQTGVCIAITVVDEGAPCEVGIGANRHCRNSASTHICEQGVCRPRPGLGAPCTALGACDAREAACVNGTCVDFGAPGDACENGFGCKLESICQEQVCTALNDNPQPPVCE